jgi:hypothetical protein
MTLSAISYATFSTGEVFRPHSVSTVMVPAVTFTQATAAHLPHFNSTVKLSPLALASQ